MTRAYVQDALGDGAWIEETVAELTEEYFSPESLRRQLDVRRDMLAAIESFLLAHWPESDSESGMASAEALVEVTLAFHLGSPEQRIQLKQVFELLATNIRQRVAEPQRRAAFGRTLYGVGDAAALEKWVRDNTEGLTRCATEAEMLAATWPILVKRIRDGKFRKWRPVETLGVFAHGWVGGMSFGELYDAMVRANVRVGLGDRPRRPSQELMVEMGEGVLGFDAALLLGGIAELLSLVTTDGSDSVKVVGRLQKRMRYGVPSMSAVILYEAGFADRVLAAELSGVTGAADTRLDAIERLREHRDAASAILSKYPQYFREVFERTIGDR